MDHPFGISERPYKLLIETLSNFPEIEQAVIFGSRAKGNLKKSSDIGYSDKKKKHNAFTRSKHYSSPEFGRYRV